VYLTRWYQDEAVDFTLRRNSLIWLPFGTGKTLIGARAILRDAELNGKRGRYLVVCPKRARDQWLDTFRNLDDFYSLHICDLSNPTPDVMNGDIVITHWEMLLRSDWLQMQTWTTVVLDEAHRIRNRKAQRSKKAIALDARHKIELTATLFDKSIDEAWHVFRWLYPKVFTSYHRFLNQFCEVSEDYWSGRKQVVGTKNGEALAKLMSKFVYHKTYEDISDTLPPLDIVVERVDMLPQQRALYDRMDRLNDIVFDDMLIPNGLAKAVRLQQVGTDPSLLEYAVGSGKLQWIDEFMEDLDQQAIIFTRFRNTAIALAAKYNAPVLVGGSPPSAADGFKAGTDKVLFGTIDSMSESLDFPRVNLAVFVDSTWSSLQMQQAIHRIYRPAAPNQQAKRVVQLCTSDTDDLIIQAGAGKITEQQLVHQLLRLTKP
jgi:superfamily II DNA or RNA helicase